MEVFREGSNKRTPQSMLGKGKQQPVATCPISIQQRNAIHLHTTPTNCGQRVSGKSAASTFAKTSLPLCKQTRAAATERGTSVSTIPNTPCRPVACGGAVHKHCFSDSSENPELQVNYQPEHFRPDDEGFRV